MLRLPLFVVGAVLALLFCPSAHAHDPRESTIDIHLTSDGLELTAALSPPSSIGLLKNPSDGAVTKENFPARRTALLAAAARVCVLLDTDGTPIAPARIHVSLNSDGEVTYLFEFPAATRPASLRTDVLASLGSGYFFAVTDHTVSPAGRAVLVRAKPACSLPVTSR